MHSKREVFPGNSNPSPLNYFINREKAKSFSISQSDRMFDYVKDNKTPLAKYDLGNKLS